MTYLILLGFDVIIAFDCILNYLLLRTITVG